MSTTKKDLNWYERYKEAAEELRHLRKDHAELLLSFSQLARHHAISKQKLTAIKETLNDYSIDN